MNTVTTDMKTLRIWLDQIKKVKAEAVEKEEEVIAYLLDMTEQEIDVKMANAKYSSFEIVAGQDVDTIEDQPKS